MLDSENQKLRLEVGGDNIGSAPACQVIRQMQIKIQIQTQTQNKIQIQIQTQTQTQTQIQSNIILAMFAHE